MVGEVEGITGRGAGIKGLDRSVGVIKALGPEGNALRPVGIILEARVGRLFTEGVLTGNGTKLGLVF